MCPAAQLNKQRVINQVHSSGFILSSLATEHAETEDADEKEGRL